jgi:hypothetical protein
MLFSTSAALDRLAPGIPSALCAPEALSWVRAAASALPAIASTACLECRLGPAAGEVDLILCVKASEGGREALAAVPPGSPLRQSPAWARVFDLVAEWSRTTSLVHRLVPFICLELDMNGPPPEAPPPLVFCCVEPSFLSALPSLEGKGDPLALTGRVIELLRGRPLSPPAERALAACFEALPRSGHVAHVGPLDARGAEAVRIVQFMSKHDLPGYLDRIGWPGSMSDVRAILEGLYSHTSHVGFQLDVAEEVSPTIGLELHHPDGDPRSALALDWLCARGACTPEERAAALGWPGVERVVLPGHRWPSVAHRMLELKVVCRPGEPLSAKAYLDFDQELSLFSGKGGKAS